MSLPVAGSVSRRNLQSTSFAKREGEKYSMFLFGFGDVAVKGNVTKNNVHRH